MAGKPQNRLELRRQYEAAEDLDPIEDDASATTDETEDEDDSGRKPAKKRKAPAKPKAKTTKAAKPAARMRVVWAVVNDAFKTVATFEYSQKEAAQAKADDLTAKGKGVYFVQRVKEAMPDDAPGLGANIPRAVPTPVSLTLPKDSSDNEDEEESSDDADDEEDDEGPDDDDE